ncbi:hypothetical protein [Wansuia hejianensis]|uniref:Uncharacterized protein n=1 Tax=Wansuia hejianensis TaxID=2763667 RepID=A0A926EYM3_9FIRM|nr:hypothetical protein [Wansuia hejianensis]MBC8590783.1 hypothetical protein [Wansuia hejianensis]
MESRMEKNKRLAREKRKRKFKAFLILLMTILVAFGIFRVNQIIKELNYLENTTLLNYDYKNNTLVFFGETYYIDFRILKKDF